MSLVNLSNRINKSKKIIVSSILFANSLLIPFSSQAKDVILSWDNSPSFIDGYSVYYGTSHDNLESGIGANEGISGIKLGDQLGFKLSGLNDNQGYYFGVKAYKDNNYSLMSNIVFSPPIDTNTSNSPIITSFNMYLSSSDFITLEIDYQDSSNIQVLTSSISTVKENTNPQSLEVILNGLKVVDENNLEETSNYVAQISTDNLNSGLNTFIAVLSDSEGNYTTSTYVTDKFSTPVAGSSPPTSLEKTLIEILNWDSTNVEILDDMSLESENFQVDIINSNPVYQISLEKGLNSYTQNLTPKGIEIRFSEDLEYEVNIGLNSNYDINLILYTKDSRTNRFLSNKIYLPAGENNKIVPLSEFNFIPNQNYSQSNLILEDLSLIIEKVNIESDLNLEVQVYKLNINEVL
ncbi:MAG: hypothetical protein PF569_05525 [Candidatus Woesearchaeota archaeon]|jgi:hypothetical protein|nr:hypothetical protein [Candidatus Woesearchaeota archaeon]